MSAPLPRSGRVAGVDYGTVRIGVAISDPQQILASPLAVYPRRDPAADAAYFRRLVAEQAVVGFIVGLPVHSSGDESQKSAEARRFGRWLGDVTGVPIGYHDERYTTRLAEDNLRQGRLSDKRRKQRRDMVAAQLILAAWLESARSENPGSLEDHHENRVL